MKSFINSKRYCNEHNIKSVKQFIKRGYRLTLVVGRLGNMTQIHMRS